MGAKVIVTSSSNEKLEKAWKLGADHAINYKEIPDWDQEVLKLVSVDEYETSIMNHDEETLLIYLCA